VTEHFALSGEEASDLLTLAEERQKVPMGESIFTREVAQGFGPKEKEQVIEMIWEIALGDGQLHRLEATMIDILAQEIGVSAAQSAAAKERAAARLGH
jgi:uncharacterized tellurite resistance protein B-like protein